MSIVWSEVDHKMIGPTTWPRVSVSGVDWVTVKGLIKPNIN